MYIKEIELQNFKTIKEFKESFSGAVYFVTGENEIGKSTLLGAISTLLTGDRSNNLLSKGEKKGFAKITVGDKDNSYEVEMRYSEKNPRGTLTITAENGMKSDNKSMIQSIFEYSNFDAHKFVAWSSSSEGRKKQVQVIKTLLTADEQNAIEKAETEITRYKEDRKEKNIVLKSINSQIATSGITESDQRDFAEEMVISDLYDEKSKAVERNRVIDQRVNKINEIREALRTHKEITKNQLNLRDQDINKLQEQIEELKNNKVVYENQREVDFDHYMKMKEEINEFLGKNKIESIAEIQAKINTASSHNAVHVKVKSHIENITARSREEKKAKLLNEKIDKLAAEKKEIISKSKLPIDGLTFTEDGLYLDDIPFAEGEISTSQEMEVAAKLMIAKNPKVKVFKVAQGESLGSEKLKAIVKFANDNGYQGFIEEVHRGQSELIVEKYSVKD